MLTKLFKAIENHQDRLTDWFVSRRGSTDLPIYSSADIRYSGYKISVVDTNLFPAGFNNLCGTFSKRAAEAFRTELARFRPEPQSVLIIPESHTRNQFYWANVQALMSILKQAGAVPVVGRCPEIGIDLPATMNLADGTVLALPLVTRREDRLWMDDESPDIVLLNNDFSHGFPELLCGVAQAVMPSPQLGWHQRRKSEHFEIYEQLVQESASIINVDPWVLSPLMSKASQIDIHCKGDRKRLQEEVDTLIAAIAEKHAQYGIDSKPYVFIKDDAGTYGMSVIHVTSGDELSNISRRMRNKMSSGKGGQPVTDYLIQEGIPTVQTYNKQPLEPVVYSVGGEAIGQFFRIHSERSDRDSLNTRGMSFDCLCSHKLEEHSGEPAYDSAQPDQMRVVSGFLAKIAAYAASLELEEMRARKQVIC